MRLLSLTAMAFGPLSDATLALAPGCTVVVGPNESAKSSWHAAAYAALCGRRRGKGRPGRAEQRFLDRHRPWDANDWRVGCLLELADGRMVELRHDLSGLVDCRATDVQLGRDVSAEIMDEGTPDAARWLGLDRRSFAATAWVAQGDLLGILDGPEDLQDKIARLAATGGGPASAAAAVARVDAFRREAVGGERAASRPLPLARQRVRLAAGALEAARQARSTHQRCWEEAARLQAVAAAAVNRERQASGQLAAWQRLSDAALAAEQSAAEASRLAAAARRQQVAADAAVAAMNRLRRAGPAPTVHRPWRAGPAPTVHLPQRVAVAAGGRPTSPAASGTTSRVPRPAAAGTSSAGTAAETELTVSRPPTPQARPPATSGSRLNAAGRPAAASAGSGRRPVLLRWAPAGVLALLFLASVSVTAVLAGSRGPAPAIAIAVLASVVAGVLLTLAGVRLLRRPPIVPPSDPWAHPDSSGAYPDDDGAVGLADLAEQATVLQAAARAGQLDAAEASARAADEEVTLTRLAAAAGAPGPPDAATAARRRDRVAAELAAARETAERARAAAASAAAVAADRADRLPDLAAAEEEHAAALRERSRLEELDEVLSLTREFLLAAQDRTHRDVAPVLADAVRPELTAITGGRWTDVAVDPGTLAVSVCGPDRAWRDARLLSHGTAEQVYLLLRLALARNLVCDGEVAPLLLDDVTARADAAREQEVLQFLHRQSADRQVVLFTHSPRVAGWAERALRGPRDALVELREVGCR